MNPTADTPVIPLDLPDGEMAGRIRCFDWRRTPLGPAETWSPSLRTTVRILLSNRFPMLLWWGPEYICIYNDAYRPILGQKHPSALGKPVRQVWSEIWDVLRPLIDTPFRGGPSTWSEDIELLIHRSGFMEETHFTIAYSPIPDESAGGGIGGVLATVVEITEKVVGQRRVTLLRDLAARASDGRSPEHACAIAAETLDTHTKDVPFSLLYLNEGQDNRARLAATSGIAAGTAISPESIPLDDPHAGWPLGVVQASGELLIIDGLSQRFPEMPPGPWAAPPRSAAIVPMKSGGSSVSGFVIAGISSRLAFDDSYRAFLELATGQIATAVANARAYEQERLRAEALANLDHAKTAFFSNVSHEFRTPLTLMLGPIEQLKQDDSLSSTQRERLTVAHRNGLRLLRLVNALLDFSRIEAGRMAAAFEPVDLASFTKQLASNFRSVMEPAGLELEVDCPPLPESVFVDCAFWEKIVLNLLSNAFKFTFYGRIAVCVRGGSGHAILSVADTGTGIPAEDLPHIFERFHRVEGASGRTYEGTGIGLALVQELVKLHGGSIVVQSQLGEGSVFTVSIPYGSAHLPEEQIRKRSTAYGQRIDSYLSEAVGWLAPKTQTPAVAPKPDANAVRRQILLADDNADMREYVAGILAGEYDVHAVSSGDAALAAARRCRPDLVLTDVMMPGLDGFGLLEALRRDPDLRDVPVIVLSARASEEARTDGISRGADDYVTKPFSAHELLVRIRAMLNLRSMRREAETERAHRISQLETLINQAPIGVFLLDADFRIQQVNPRALPTFEGVPDPVGRDFGEVVLKLVAKEHAEEIVGIFRHTLETGEPYLAPERASYRFGGGEKKFFEWRADRIVLPDGRNGVVCYFHDITALIRSREAIAQSEQRLSLAVEGGGMGTWDVDLSTGESIWSAQHFAMLGYSAKDGGKASIDMWRACVHPDDLPRVDQRIDEALATGIRYISEHRILRADTGEVRWLSEFGQVISDEYGDAARFVGISFDNTARKRAEQEQSRIAERLRHANADLKQFAYSVSHDLQEPLRGVRIYSELLAMHLEGRLSEEDSECLEQVRDASERMETLLRDLSSYIEAGGIDRNVAQTADAEVCLAAAMANLAAAIKSSGARIQHEALPSLRVDPTRLQQVFQNLISNSIKYRKSEIAPEIHISAQRQGDMWCFAVRDNGIGIAPEFQNRIFGLFKRLHTRQRYAGSGIGLALCARIIEQYRGRIWVESGAGEGATFFFTLPA